MRWWMLVAAGCVVVLGGALWFAASDPEPVTSFVPTDPGPQAAAPPPPASPRPPPSAELPAVVEPSTQRKVVAIPSAPVITATPPAPPPLAPAIVLPAATGAAAPGGAISNGVAELPMAEDEGWEEEAPAMKTVPLPPANVRQRSSDVVARQRLREAAAQIRGATIQR